MLPGVVSRPRLVGAVSVDMASFNLARIVAPLVGGAVLASWGGPAAYGLIAGLFAVSVLVVMSLRPAAAAREVQPPLWADLKEVLALLKTDQVLTANMLFTAVNAVMLGGVIYLLPAFAAEELGAGERGLSALFTAVGAGAFAGAVWLSMSGGVRRAGAWLIVSNLLFASATAVFAYSGQMAVAVLAAVALGLFNTVHATLGVAAIQIASPEAMRGRVFGVYEVAWGVFPLGGLVLGSLAAGIGLPASLAAGAALTAAFTLAVWWRAPKVRALAFPR
jgi:predicted MFS family arabinose efflux permease